MSSLWVTKGCAVCGSEFEVTDEEHQRAIEGEITTSRDPFEIPSRSGISCASPAEHDCPSDPVFHVRMNTDKASDFQAAVL